MPLITSMHIEAYGRTSSDRSGQLSRGAYAFTRLGVTRAAGPLRFPSVLFHHRSRPLKKRVQIVSRPTLAVKRFVFSGLESGICGGSQQIVPAALLGGSVNVKALAFLTEVPDVRLSLG